jgi:hypothetical protein
VSSLLGAAVAVLVAGCASEPAGPQGGEGHPGRSGAGRRSARSEGRAAPEAWKQYDLNADGKVTRGEFMAVRATCFARADANGDGLLTRTEILKVLPPQRAERIEAIFAQMHLDKDGAISREEFDQESDRLFRQLDTNADTVLAGTEVGSLIPAVLGDLCAEGTSHAAPARP